MIDTNIDEKVLLAPYLNQANDNFAAVLNAIAAKVGAADAGALLKAFNIEDAKILDATHPRINLLKATTLLYRHFPFLEGLLYVQPPKIVGRDSTGKPAPEFKWEEIRPKKIYRELTELQTMLKNLRHFHTHTQHSPIVASAHFIGGMYKVFALSVSGTLHRFQLKKEDIAHLDRPQPGKSRWSDAHYFYYFTDSEEKAKKPYKHPKGTYEKLSKKGLLFLTCLFLEKVEGYKLLKSVYGFKRDNEPNFKATLQAFTHYSVRLPKERVATNHTEDTLLLDLAGELMRCPNRLFDTLSSEDRDRFRTKEGYALDSDEMPDEEDTPESLLKRKGRFAELALRYMEFDPAFAAFQFPIDLGDFYFKVYEKDSMSERVIRRLPRKLLIFGQLKAINREKRPAEWEALVKKTKTITDEMGNETVGMERHENPFITDAVPHYHLHNQQVLIHLLDVNASNTTIYPALDMTNGKLKQEHKGRFYYLSEYDLPALLFYHHLLKRSDLVTEKEKTDAKNDPIKLEQLQSKKEKEKLQAIFNSFFYKKQQFISAIGKALQPLPANKRNKSGLEELLAPYKIPAQDLNDRLRAYFMGNDAAKIQLVTKRLDTAIEKNERRSASLKKQVGNQLKVKFGKREQPLRNGEMALWLSKDILKLQPSHRTPDQKGNDKANSSEFAILQERLALFMTYKQELKATFRAIRLVDSDNEHPFLEYISLDECTNILDFYIQYLQKRGAFLNDCKQKVKTNPDYCDHFIKIPKKLGADTLQKYLAAQRKEPINLPRGVFDTAIKDLLQTAYATEMETTLPTSANTAYLIRNYLKDILKDDVQPFYTEMKRNYELIDRLEDTRRPKRPGDALVGTLKKHYYSVAELSAGFKARKQMVQAKEKAIETAKPPKIMNGLSGLSAISLTQDNPALKEARKYRLLFNQYEENEKQIRLFQTQDIVLYLAMMELYRKQVLPESKDMKDEVAFWGNITQGFRLTAMQYQKENTATLLETKRDLRLPIKLENGNIIYITGENVPFKRYGDFRRFVMQTQKNTTLWAYFPNGAEISRFIFQDEIQEYAAVQKTVLGKVLEFEKEMYLRFADKIKAANTNTNYIDHEPYLTVLKNEIGIDDDLLKKAKELRNAFSHNRYPDDEIIKTAISSDGKKKSNIAMQIKEMVLDKTYIEFLKRLKGA